MSLKTHSTLLEQSARPNFHSSVLYITYYYYYYYFEKHNNYVSLLTNLIVCRDRPSNTKDEATEIQKRGYGFTELSLRKYRDEAACRRT